MQGMNRIRHAYHEAVGGLDPYFIAGQYDDAMGVFGMTPGDFRSTRSIIHGFTTVVGMVGVINAALAGVLVAAVILIVGSGAAAVVAGIATFAIVLAWAVSWTTRTTHSTVASLHPNFPTPASGDRPAS